MREATFTPCTDEVEIPETGEKLGSGWLPPPPDLCDYTELNETSGLDGSSGKKDQGGLSCAVCAGTFVMVHDRERIGGDALCLRNRYSSLSSSERRAEA